MSEGQFRELREALEQACDDIEVMRKVLGSTLLGLEAERNVRHYRKLLAALPADPPLPNPDPED